MVKESQMDGRSRFKNMFDGTCKTRAGVRQHQFMKRQKTHLKNRVREEKDCQANQILSVSEVEIRFHVIQLRVAKKHWEKLITTIIVGNKYLRIANTCPIKKRKEVKKRKPWDEGPVDLAD